MSTDLYQIPPMLLLAIAIAISPLAVRAENPDRPGLAQKFGRERAIVSARPDGLIVCEGEEFRTGDSAWKAGNFGENYYAATFANCFLSRMAFLGAPEQCAESIATIRVKIPKAGKYLALVRYEAAYRFETQFRLQIEQRGKTVLDRRYGARNNLKIWAFNQKLKTEVGWSWGAGENIVWEGHDAFAELEPGEATLRLIAGKQPEPAARRNIDLVMLTTDVEQVNERIEKEKYLPLDGMLTQSGDVWLRVKNTGTQKLTFKGGKAAGAGKGNWKQHSPYWVHLRNWEVPTIEVAPGAASDWVEVGGTMDSLAHGQWHWTGDGKYEAEFAVLTAAGKRELLAVFKGEGELVLAADADTRYTRQLRRQEDVLYDLLAYLKRQPVHGRAPEQMRIYGYTFDPLDEGGPHSAGVKEFKDLFALQSTKPEGGYTDVRGVKTDQLESFCREKLGVARESMAVVSLGDEIGLPRPPAKGAQQGFQEWVKAKGVGATDLRYDPGSKNRLSDPAGYYWSNRYLHDYGIAKIKERTDILRRELPNAGIGANYSPHYPQHHLYLGEVHKWVSVFRQDGMTMPWGEDYIWQVPVVSPQINNINLDLFRAGIRHHPERKILYYVMPHMPNNTPNQWRRLFYGALAHGAKIINLFEFRPVHAAYTENHVDHPEMYGAVLRAFRELGVFEDLLQAGRVRGAEVALWFSETGDIWDDNHGAFAAAKRALYLAIRNRQLPLDFVVEPDALDGTLKQYKVLYLTDRHVSSAASARIADWVQAGGNLFATAGAGMLDELNRPNTVMRKLLGVEQTALEAPEDKQLIWIKQDLPFAEPIDSVGGMPVFGAKSLVKPVGATVEGTFGGGAPAVTRRKVGKGTATYCAFLPGLSYFHPAIPKRPVDRGATDDAFVHFLPTKFDGGADSIIASVTRKITPTVVCSVPLVETTVIESPAGTIVPLINWSGKPVKNLEVTIRLPVGTKATLASGATVNRSSKDGVTVCSFPLDVADALILRR